jgi:hypothetical protein
LTTAGPPGAGNNPGNLKKETIIMAKNDRELKCKDRIEYELQERIDDLRTLWTLYQSGDEEGDPEIGSFNEYGLCFDFVAPETFENQNYGYYRYQLSYGGPSDEFRFMTEDPNAPAPPVEYWFLDWFDGAHIHLKGDDLKLLHEIWQFFVEIGSTESEYNKAV